MRVAQIGIAGENGVLYSAIMHDVNRAAGRNGLGAVMGSKNLKAVAVRGRENVPQGNRPRILPVSKWIGQEYKESMSWAVTMGTPGSVAFHARTSNLPVRNFQDASFPDAPSIDGKLMAVTIRKERDTCQACPVYCKQVVEYEGQAFEDQPLLKTTLTGKTAIDPVYGGPEYETLGAFGSACGVTDLVAVAKANELSARWGLDTISAGMTIAYVMELVDRGLLTAEQTGGFLPRWGDGEAVVEAVDMIAHCRGFGEKMAQGSKRISQWVGQGSDAYLIEVKGQEFPMHEPRTKVGLGLGYAVAPVGADHMMNIHDGDYSSPGGAANRVRAVYPAEPMPVTALDEKKVELFYHEVNWTHFMDCAVVCAFYPYNYVHLAEAVSGATGRDYAAGGYLAGGRAGTEPMPALQPARGAYRSRRPASKAHHDAVHRGAGGGRRNQRREPAAGQGAVVRTHGLDAGRRADRGAPGPTWSCRAAGIGQGRLAEHLVSRTIRDRGNVLRQVSGYAGRRGPAQ